jgi:hypothetical protein
MPSILNVQAIGVGSLTDDVFVGASVAGSVSHVVVVPAVVHVFLTRPIPSIMSAAYFGTISRA